MTERDRRPNSARVSDHPAAAVVDPGSGGRSGASSQAGRKTHWDEVYRDKSPLEVSWYQLEPRTSLYMIDLALKTPRGSDGGLIDVGGGASVLVDRLLARGWSDIG